MDEKELEVLILSSVPYQSNLHGVGLMDVVNSKLRFYCALK